MNGLPLCNDGEFYDHGVEKCRSCVWCSKRVKLLYECEGCRIFLSRSTSTTTLKTILSNDAKNDTKFLTTLLLIPFLIIVIVFFSFGIYIIKYKATNLKICNLIRHFKLFKLIESKNSKQIKSKSTPYSIDTAKPLPLPYIPESEVTKVGQEIDELLLSINQSRSSHQDTEDVVDSPINFEHTVQINYRTSVSVSRSQIGTSQTYYQNSVGVAMSQTGTGQINHRPSISPSRYNTDTGQTTHQSSANVTKYQPDRDQINHQSSASVLRFHSDTSETYHKPSVDALISETNVLINHLSSSEELTSMDDSFSSFGSDCSYLSRGYFSSLPEDTRKQLSQIEKVVNIELLSVNDRDSSANVLVISYEGESVTDARKVINELTDLKDNDYNVRLVDP